MRTLTNEDVAQQLRDAYVNLDRIRESDCIGNNTKRNARIENAMAQIDIVQREIEKAAESIDDGEQ